MIYVHVNFSSTGFILQVNDFATKSYSPSCVIHVYFSDLPKRMEIKWSNEHDDYVFNQATESIQTNIDFGFLHALVVTISFIVVSEICDKTFFIVTIMAMRYSFLIIYTGAMSALITMTIISALLGKLVTKFLPTIYTRFYQTYYLYFLESKC